MTERLATLASLIEPCGTFADVGCDHGYISEAVLERGLADFVVATDISAPSLLKCENRLKPFDGRYQALCTDGLKGVERNIDQAIIAGMGGKEIISVLSARKGIKRLILQPMKNSPELRKYLIGAGYTLERDFTFFSLGKRYDVIVALLGRTCEPYTADEIEYGRENLADADFLDYLRSLLALTEEALNKVKGERERLELTKRRERLLRLIK